MGVGWGQKGWEKCVCEREQESEKGGRWAGTDKRWGRPDKICANVCVNESSDYS